MSYSDVAGLLVRGAEIDGVGGLDVRCRGGLVAEIGRGLKGGANEREIAAKGGALLPGLHDHHIHLLALAAASRSLPCGPPAVNTRTELRDALRNAPGGGWIRGVGYHESVAGLLDRQALDGLEATRPVRVQHRSGKMWFLNSAALREIGQEATDGRLFRADAQLRERWPRATSPGDVEDVSRRLASYGVTGLTEATPHNNRDTVAFYGDLDLRQRVNCMGDESLDGGSLKIILDDAQLPPFDAARDRIANAHERGRPVAVHCATRTELVFALAAIGDAGVMRGDRIEHASVTDAAALTLFRELGAGDEGATVVTQPNFVAERGDRYLRDVPHAEHPHLYRCRAFLDAGIPLGGGTDAPFGDADPWRAMRAAVDRRTAHGDVLGAEEALTPEQALALFTSPLDAPGAAPRRIAVGTAADFCLLTLPWRQARVRLRSDDVAATVRDGRVQWSASMLA